MSERTIDFSRYRVAEAIVELYEAGESPEEIGLDYFGWKYGESESSLSSTWIVELIVAASDHKGKHYPKGEPGHAHTFEPYEPAVLGEPIPGRFFRCRCGVAGYPT